MRSIKFILLVSTVLFLVSAGNTAADPVPAPWFEQTIGDDLPEGSADYTLSPESLEVTATFDRLGGDIVFSTPYPTSPAPANGETDVAIETNLTWTRGDGAVADELYFGTESAPSLATVIPNTSPALFDPGDANLIPSTTYYWQIVEVNGLDRYEGPIWSFSTVSGKTSVVFPADGAVISGRLYCEFIYIWLDFKAGPTNVSFECFFSDNYEDVLNREVSVSLGAPPYPNQLRYYVGFPTIPPYTQSLVRETTYYWCVDGSDAFGRTFPGDIWRFTIQGYRAFDPDPFDGAVVSGPDVLLSWKPGIRVTEHDVYFGTDLNSVEFAEFDFVFPPPEFLATTTEPNILVTGLAFNTRYYWRIDEVYNRSLPPVPGGEY
jgi:hypothetical protein